MRKLFRLLALVSVVALVACEDKAPNENDNKPNPPQQEQPETPEEPEEPEAPEEPEEPEDEVIILTQESPVNIYRQGYEGLGVDHYYFGLCDTLLEDHEGVYVPDNLEGTLFWCSFYGEPTPDPENPTLPEGTYTFKGNDKVAGNLDTFETYIVRRKITGQPEIIALSAATVSVEHAEKGYIINLEYTLESGEVLRARYEDTIRLLVGTQLTAPTPWIEEDYTTEFVGIYANLTGDSYYTPEADVIGVQLYDIALGEDNSQMGGIVVQLQLTTPELDGPNPMIPDGTYNVSMGTELYSTPVGDVINMGGSMGHTMFGTAARLMDENGDYSYAAFLSGTVIVATEGEEQTISVDLSTDTISVKGSYTGAVTINNYTYTPPVSNDPFSTLTGNKTVTPKSNWLFTADYYTAYEQDRDDISMIRFRGYSADPNDVLNIPMDGFEGFRFDLIVENTGTILTAIPSGTYMADSDGTHKANTFLLGTREEADGGMRYKGSYGWMGYDWLGFIDPTRLAPLAGGAIVITDYGNSEYGIEYNVQDDKGNTITLSHRATVKFAKAQ